MFELVERLSEQFGVSGNEEDIRQLIITEVSPYVDEIRVDALGNLIAIKKGPGKKLMVAAHMDEIGVMATYIDDKGFIRFSAIGGVYTPYALAQKVRFRNGTVGAVFYEEKLDDLKSIKFSHLYIDIGATSREEAEKSVRIGDTACFEGKAIRQGRWVMGKAMDNRSGCAVAVKTIQSKPETDHEIYYVFTVQEELGLRGAKTAAYGIQPDIAIALDVTSTGDTPEGVKMEVACGKGPAVKIKDRSVISHPEVRNLIVNAAEKLNVPLQYEILEHGGSDPGTIHLTAGGIPSGAISIPCRYVHSPVETVNLDDLENAVKLLGQCLVDYRK